MLNSISRLGETRPEQEWSNGTEFCGYSDFPEKRVHSKRIPKFSKTFPGIFTVPFSFGPEISVFLVEWKAPNVLTDQFQTVRPVLASDWCQKTFVVFCPITEQQG